jgi:excisionase family DNA binding protein
MTTRTSRRAPKPRSAPLSAGSSAPSDTSQRQPDPAAERLAYSVNEAARLTGLSRDLLYDQMRQGNLDYIKVGRRRLITRHHLEQFLDITPGAQQPGRISASPSRTVSDAP